MTGFTAARRRIIVTLAAAAGALAGIGVLAVTTAQAQRLVADLSSHLIAITTGFTGTEVVLFGTTEGPSSDVVVVVTGPRTSVTVRRKDRVAGLWLNREKVVFAQVPTYYAVAATGPLDRIASTFTAQRHQLGPHNIKLDTGRALPPEELAEFRDALVRNQQRAGLYARNTAPVSFLGDRLFRTNLTFPANVHTGLYNVEVFQIRDGEVVSAQTTPLVVAKIGFSAEVYEFGRNQPLAYGIAATVGALLIGWATGMAFRKV